MVYEKSFDRSCRDLQTSVGLNNETWHLSSKNINYWEPANSTTNFEKSPYHWDYQRIGSTPGISPISVPTRFMTPWYPRPLVHPDTKTSERPRPLTFIENRRYESTLRISQPPNTPKRSETHLHHNFNVGNPIITYNNPIMWGWFITGFTTWICTKFSIFLRGLQRQKGWEHMRTSQQEMIMVFSTPRLGDLGRQVIWLLRNDHKKWDSVWREILSTWERRDVT